MKVWQMILLIVAIIAIWLFLNKKEEKPIAPFIKINSDSLYNVIKNYQLQSDSLLIQIEQLKQNKQKIIIRYYEKDNNIRSLNADSSIRLFAEWNRQLQDSSYKKRYFRIGSDTIYNKF